MFCAFWYDTLARKICWVVGSLLVIGSEIIEMSLPLEAYKEKERNITW